MSVEGKFLSKEINDLFWREGLTLVTAESCTAGSVAAAITAVAGSSHFFKGGIIAYSNEIKENLLGVNHGTLETHGAVSEETVIEMVKGAMKSMNSDCAVATSGIAGPTGGTPDKPVGTIWIAAGCKDKSDYTEIGRRRRKKQKHCKCNPKCTATAPKVVPKRRK